MCTSLGNHFCSVYIIIGIQKCSYGRLLKKLGGGGGAGGFRDIRNMGVGVEGVDL